MAELALLAMLALLATLALLDLEAELALLDRCLGISLCSIAD